MSAMSEQEIVPTSTAAHSSERGLYSLKRNITQKVRQLREEIQKLGQKQEQLLSEAIALDYLLKKLDSDPSVAEELKDVFAEADPDSIDWRSNRDNL